MEEFYSLSEQKQNLVFDFMNMVGTESVELAYFLLKDSGWNPDSALDTFFAGANLPPSGGPASHEGSETSMPQKTETFDQAFPSLNLRQQVSDKSQVMSHRESYTVDETKLQECIDRISQHPKYKQRLLKSRSDIKDNKDFIVFLNESFKTKIRFSFGSFTSNLALAYLKKKPLLVYVHQDKNGARGLLRALLQDPAITSYINQHFVVYGMFDNSNDYGALEGDIPISGLPGLAGYCYNYKENKPVFLGAHKLIEEEPLDIIEFLGKIVTKFQTTYLPQKYSSLKKSGEQRGQKELVGQATTNKSVIEEQNQLYRQMEEEFKMKRQVSRLDKQEVLKKNQLAEKNKLQFQKQPQGPDSMEFVFRMPSGVTLKRRFTKEDKVKVSLASIQSLFVYVDAFGSQQFQHPHGQFDLIQTYPPVDLSQRLNQNIGCVFQNSGRENIIIRQK